MAEYFASFPHRSELIWDVLLPNVMLGVSCEDQQTADERIPLLLQTPAAVRFVSLEPLLGPVIMDEEWLMDRCPECGTYVRRGWRDCPMPDCDGHPRGSLDWVILGGESGPRARPMHPKWARDVRDQCVAAGVSYFHKQNGEWFEGDNFGRHCQWCWVSLEGTYSKDISTGAARMFRVGKRATGHLLDGKEWHQMPEVKR